MYSNPHTRSNLRLFGGSSHPDLTRAVAKKVGVKPGQTKLSKFANKESHVELMENVRGQDVYVLQTAGGPSPNDSLMELLLLINAFKMSAAGNITVITPLFPYSKGDQKDGNRVPISSKLVADLLAKSGASLVMMLDPHTPQMEGFFSSPVDALKVEPLFCEWIKHHVPNWEDCMIVSPDEGAVKKSVCVANDLSLDFALIHNRNNVRERVRTKKYSSAGGSSSGGVRFVVDGEEEEEEGRKEEEGSSSSSSSTTSSSSGRKRSQTGQDKRPGERVGCLSGSVAGRNVIMIDDMIDTGRTLRFAAEVLKREGASRLYMLATHGILSEGSAATIAEFSKDFLEAVVVTNSVPQDEKKKLIPNLHVVEVAGLIAEFVRRHHYHESVSVLSQFMPIRDEPRHGGQDEMDLDRLNLGGVDVGADDHVGVDDDDRDSGLPSSDPAARGAESADRPENKNVRKLRKGFRLSSVCWDKEDF